MNPQVVQVALAVLGLLMTALMGVCGFLVGEIRRMRQETGRELELINASMQENSKQLTALQTIVTMSSDLRPRVEDLQRWQAAIEAEMKFLKREIRGENS